MKKLLPIIFAVLFIISFSCKKAANEFSIPPGDPNNQVNAFVTVSGDTTFSLFAFNSVGNNTDFSRNIHSVGDTVINILGSTSKGDIKIILENINLPGTYLFKNDTTSSQFSNCTYVIGDALLGPVFLFYSTPSDGSGGTVTIESISSNSIKGSFNATCLMGISGKVQLTNGSFKGNF